MTGRRFSIGALLLVLAALAGWLLATSRAPATRSVVAVQDAAPDAERTSRAPIEAATPAAASVAALVPESLPLAQRLPALESLAREGHPEAACRLAVERIRCAQLRRWRPDGDDLERELRLESEGSLEQANDLASESLLRVRLKSECEQAGATGDADVLSLLAAAASKHGPAAVLYFEVGRTLRHRRGIYQDPAFDALRRNAARHLQAAFEAGVPEASRSLQMAHWIDSDFATGLVEDDPARAWFHLVLSSQLFGTTLHPDTVARVGLPEADRARITAEATAHRLRHFGPGVFRARGMDARGIHGQPELTASDFCGPPIPL